MVCSYPNLSLVKLEIVFSVFTDAISRLSTIWPVVDVSFAWSSRSGIADISPKAVVFMATEQGGDIGEQGHVGRASLQLGDDLHHALFHGDFDVIASPDRTLARQSHPQHLRHVGLVLVGHFPGFFELSLDQHRMQRVPHLLVFAPDAVQMNPAFKRDGHSERKHEQNGVHEHPTLLEKRYYGIEAHRFPPLSKQDCVVISPC
jgi:hypothetical protein